MTLTKCQYYGIREEYGFQKAFNSLSRSYLFPSKIVAGDDNQSQAEIGLFMYIYSLGGAYILRWDLNLPIS